MSSLSIPKSQPASNPAPSHPERLAVVETKINAITEGIGELKSTTKQQGKTLGKIENQMLTHDERQNNIIKDMDSLAKNFSYLSEESRITRKEISKRAWQVMFTLLAFTLSIIGGITIQLIRWLMAG